MIEKPIVMISSTALDLPDYRGQVKDACLRASMFPKMMELQPALDDDAIEASLKLVDEADVYLGLFAHRYGYIPHGLDKSITHMEYERAVERDIPRLIYLMSDNVPVLPQDYDRGDSFVKLDALKARLKQERVVDFFESPKDLRGLALHALSRIKKQYEEKTTDGSKSAKASAGNFHYVSAIPDKGEAYIAHPYTLLQVKGLIGRKRELEMLTDWVTKPKYKNKTILNVVAIGGMGKSALTWTWFNEIVAQETKLTGRVWWSFYESDATLENFINRTLAYVSGCSLEELKDMSFVDQQNALLSALNKEPYLLVLDGLERILIAYARQDAAFLSDDTALDDKTANRVAGAHGLAQIAGKSFIGKHQLRKTADVRAGQFLRRLAQIRNTRILVSTRLYPADLQRPNGQPCPGCFALFLKGLSDQDALDLWRAYGAKGSREAMLPIFRTFDLHPLLIQLLAYEVAEFHEAAGDFDAWRAANPDFNPFDLPLVQVQSNVLAQALRGLTKAELHTLHVIAGFRMPASMETIKALLVQSNGDDYSHQKPFSTLKELDRSLTALEDRGLLGWDRRANRYDLHPIVRGVVWSGLDDDVRSDIYGFLRSHFEAIPMIGDWSKVECVEDLTPTIELYNTLIGLGNYDEAFTIFRDRLDNVTLYRLSSSRLRLELLERLFPDGLDTMPSLNNVDDRSSALHALAATYHFSGRPADAIKPIELSIQIDRDEYHRVISINKINNLSYALRISGAIYKSEAAAKTALSQSKKLSDEDNIGWSFQSLGRVMAQRGLYKKAEMALNRSLRMSKQQYNIQREGVINGYLAEMKLGMGELTTACLLADRAWELAEGGERYIKDLVYAARLQGIIALHMGELEFAHERLHYALSCSRCVHLVQEELPILVDLAVLNLEQKKAEKARELLEEIWESAERGPYPTFHADGLYVLAQIEQDADNRQAAIQAATESYCKAWCDGPPFAYHSGLEKAQILLAALGASKPELPPFDESKFEPMPEVEVNLDEKISLYQNIRLQASETHKLAKSLIRAKNCNRALEYLSIGLNQSPNDISMLECKAECLHRLNRITEAIAVHEKLINDKSLEFWACVNLLEFYLLVGNINKFDKLYEKYNHKVRVADQYGEYFIYYLEILKAFVTNDLKSFYLNISNIITKKPIGARERMRWIYDQVLQYLNEQEDTDMKIIFELLLRFFKGEIDVEMLSKSIEHTS